MPMCPCLSRFFLRVVCMFALDNYLYVCVPCVDIRCTLKGCRLPVSISSAYVCVILGHR